MNEIENTLLELPERISGCADIEACLALAELPFIAECKKQGRKNWMLRLTQPVDASGLAELWGWKLPYAFSGDVHQESWTIGLYDGEVEDEYSHRIALLSPSFGQWIADIVLAGRPEGKLPDTVAGASPAYSLAEYSSSTDRIRFREN